MKLTTTLVALFLGAAPALAQAPAPASEKNPESAALYEIDTEAQKAPPANTPLARILESLHVRVCVRSDVPPLGYFSSGQLEGFDVELASELVKQLGIDYKRVLKIEWTVVTAEERMKHLQQNGCDILVAALSHTKERAGQAELSKIYVRTDKVLLAAGNITRKSPVIAQVGGTTGDAGIKGTPRPFHTYQEVAYAMELGGIDYLVTDRPIAEHLMRSTTKPFKITKTLAKDAESYAVATPKGDPLLIQAVNRALEDLARSGRLAFIQRRWL
ncbi:MAG TPA: transporter substrate-binding domain-containing protein [Kofleriaceae bacterium]|nr:transporter substrate-binding domain-containing protein [Kofleriaceae bacterium]